VKERGGVVRRSESNIDINDDLEAGCVLPAAPEGKIMPRVFCCAFLLFFYCLGAVAPDVTYGQEKPAGSAAAKAALSVGGEVEPPLALQEADLMKLPRHTARVADHNGVEATFAGAPLVDILRLAGVKLGEQLRGQEMTTYVLVTAADNYQVVFAVAELDPGFTDRVIFLADQRNGHPLSAEEGPLRIIVPGEKRHARWVRQVTTLTVLRAKAN
jgi:DMSO/TMAO reductase YedYZ molybdopterin-dependent catalytic subunit